MYYSTIFSTALVALFATTGSAAPANEAYGQKLAARAPQATDALSGLLGGAGGAGGLDTLLGGLTGGATAAPGDAAAAGGLDSLLSGLTGGGAAGGDLLSGIELPRKE